jgi:hypothetical protein
MTAPLRHSDLGRPRCGRGHRTPETLFALAERNRLLVEAATLYFPLMSKSEAACRLHVALSRYEAGAWRRARALDEIPARHVGCLAGHCWRILRARDHTPSSRSIRLILARSAFPCQPSDA